jgi:hypothetical protein
MNHCSRVLVALAALGGSVLVGELVARYGLWLGTPPLYEADSLSEYRLKPNQRLTRFENRISVNATSMRSAPLAADRHPGSRRLLAFGDSVVWGGSVLDQPLIATERLRQAGIPEVGNVAAPSWAPATGWAMRAVSAFSRPPMWCW